MFISKNSEQINADKQSNMLSYIQERLPKNATLVKFDYNEKVFGNIIAHIKINDIIHVFVTDRGEIYHNGKMICDSSYRRFEEKGTFLKLVDIIQYEISK